MYQRSNTAVSCRRKSAARSMTRVPAASSSAACAMATPCGVAKNTTSQSVSEAFSGAEKASFTRPRRLGYMSATGNPSSLRDVMAVNSTWGCCDSRRSSSTPVYPVPPTMPTLMREFDAWAMVKFRKT
ncbi:Uncharacterised protein [Bordetella pertussis]|nr:Uncharacterised protein [Bordetella pertussis]